MKDRFNVLQDELHASYQGIFIKWLLLVTINSAPSIWIAFSIGYNLTVMLLVIFCFIIFYARLEWHWRQDQQRFSLHISVLNKGVMLRCLSIALFMGVDIFCGAIAFMITMLLLPIGTSQFFSTILATLLQGIFLSLVLFGLGSIAVEIHHSKQ
ncbi:MAG: hypothetical protein AAF518_23945 [Spirochaetota bacterium]